VKTDRWHQIQALFDEALARPKDERTAFLRAACGEDPALYAELESLLEADDGSHTLLDGTVLDALPEAALMEGQRVGAFRILEQIGTGGMGTVFLAERADGQFEQRVALKLIKRGMDSEQILRRFRNERQILARLNHPHITRLLDGGLTDDGRPYFAMEYVEGVPIDDYCDAHHLNIEERLQLFRAVGEAVQYAHRNLIVHRDLKPENILVTEDGRIKLLDFGIAKVLEEDDAARTQVGRRVMTPAYAAPEQVRGEPVTTATDVYAMGLLLFELLLGHLPYGVTGQPREEIERRICQDEPAPPSTMVGRTREDCEITPETISMTRRTRTDRLRRHLSGDLDTICLKALRKEPERRYVSAEQFVEDIRRHLDGLPVLARRETGTYRLQKFIRRHRTGVVASILLIFAVGILTAFYTGQLRLERDRARLEAEKASEVSTFLQDLFTLSDPSEARGEQVTVREILDDGAARVQSELSNQPVVQASMLQVIGRVYHHLGLYDKARPLLEQALAIRRAQYGPAHPDVATTLDELAGVRYEQGDFDASEDLYRRALAMNRQLHGEGHTTVAMSLHNLAHILFQKGEYPASDSLYIQAIALQRTLKGEDDADLGTFMASRAQLAQFRGDYPLAESLYDGALQRQRAGLGVDHPETITTLHNYAVLLQDMGELGRAESLFREALERSRRVQGEEHPDVAATLTNLGRVLFDQGKYDEAESMYREALALDEKRLGREHPYVAYDMNNLARLLQLRRHGAEAERLYRDAYGIYTRTLPEGHPYKASLLLGLGTLLIETSRTGEADTRLREGLDIAQKALPEGHWLIGSLESALGHCLSTEHRYPEAEQLLLTGYATLMEKKGAQDRNTRQSLRYLAVLYKAWDKPASAARYEALLADASL